MTKLRDFNVRGLAGVVYSRGMNTLTDEANKIPGVSATTEDQGTVITWFSGVNNLYQSCLLAHHSQRALVLVGHSFGANACIMAANRLAAQDISVDLLVAVDPAKQDTCVVPHNVKWVINPYQLEFGQMGQGIVEPFPGYTHRDVIAGPKDHAAEEFVYYAHNTTMHIQRYRFDQPHITIDDDPRVHKLALDAMKTLLTQQATPKVA